MKDSFMEVEKGIKWVLNNCTSYQVAKDLDINNRTVNRYQNGESPLENMTLGTAEKLFNYYLKEMKKVKNHESLNDVNFNGKTLEHAGWSGGDVEEENLYKQFYVTKRESLKENFDHYAVWWDLTNFFVSEEKEIFEWPTPHSIYSVKDSPEALIEYVAKFIPFNKEVELQERKYTILNRPVKFSKIGGDMIYWAAAMAENGDVYKVYWNIFNMIDPCKIEMTVDNSRYCKHCLQNWTLKETKCTNTDGHEFVEN